MTDILFFEPHLDERIWGGDHLRHLYNALSSTQTIGEAWLISGMKNASSTIKNGKYAGKPSGIVFVRTQIISAFLKAPSFLCLLNGLMRKPNYQFKSIRMMPRQKKWKTAGGRPNAGM